MAPNGDRSSDALHKRKRKAVYKTMAKDAKRLQRGETSLVRSRQSLVVGDRGLLVTCVRGRENQSVNELAGLLDDAARLVYPHLYEEESGGQGDVEKEIMAELQDLKQAGSHKTPKFQSLVMGTDCVAFIKIEESLDPVKLTRQIFDSLIESNQPRARFLHRLIPAPRTCSATLVDIEALAKDQCGPIFHNGQVEGLKYSIQPRLRLHHKLERMQVIDCIAAVIDHAVPVSPVQEGRTVPARHVVDLSHPEHIILVEIIKSICMICVVKADDYDACRKYNIQMVNESIVKAGQGEKSALEASEDAAGQKDRSVPEAGEE